jgi:Secretion system C-terminal sorting domain
MKKFATLFAGLVLFCISINAQILDTLSIGAGYSQAVWYKFDTDVKTKKTNLDWDLAFSTRVQRDAAINTNPYATLYKAIAPAAQWSTVIIDTLKLVPQSGVDTSWSMGTFNLTGDNVFNYGWGNYNTSTHNVNGDSLYVIKTVAGAWKKIIIDKLSYDTTYTFRYADLNGMNEVTATVSKSKFVGKNFGYYSISANNTLDKEPLNKDWDIVASRYYGLTPDQNGVLQSYPLTGILQNDGVKVSKIIKRDTANNTYDANSFLSKINIIGSDWKSFDQTTNKWKLADSTAYFIKTTTGKIYKMVFTNFGGSSTGNMIFTRSALKTTSINDINDNISALAVYPNPASDGNITFLYDLGKNVQNVDIQLFNIAGQSVFNQKVVYTEGLQQFEMPQLNLHSGIYFARVSSGNKSLIQKLIIK